jgi:hypothetical protein
LGAWQHRREADQLWSPHRGLGAALVGVHGLYSPRFVPSGDESEVARSTEQAHFERAARG